MSATPGAYELQRSEQIAQQLIRPTGIVDPTVEVRPTEGQIDDLIDRIRERVDRKERVLVTTLTKKMAEDLADYLHEMGVKVSYLHSEVDTLERVQILRDLRLGIYDVLVGINLLREGIDLPEVTLVAILDADKEGFLRSAWSLIQVIRPGGPQHRRPGRHVRGPHHRLDAGRHRRDEPPAGDPGGLQRRARHHAADDHQGDPRHQRPAAGGGRGARRLRLGGRELTEMSKEQIAKMVGQLEAEMRSAAKQLEFERAAALRDEIQDIRLRVLEEDASTTVLKAAERAATRSEGGRPPEPARRWPSPPSGSRRRAQAIGARVATSGPARPRWR